MEVVISSKKYSSVEALSSEKSISWGARFLVNRAGQSVSWTYRGRGSGGWATRSQCLEDQVPSYLMRNRSSVRGGGCWTFGFYMRTSFASLKNVTRTFPSQ